ncbi:hypothetical protein M918_15720 [Clostridium sp. BL8]|uniref:hypothetical protein n=1 Tax=Clostridium sp. BL8 TaxID=1354301 RepID=UPI00038A030A|nr:hypothetical protein [Clostridium sp. BL8]EQB86163.1 hypothetical protein M918_15720 [Clostridium sp. BL8]
MKNGWSRNTLAHQIESNFFERQNNDIKIINFMEKLETPYNVGRNKGVVKVIMLIGVFSI